jgi:serine/threonine-protein kinase
MPGEETSWDALKAAFHDCLDLAPAERERRLAEIAGRDPDLGRELGSLLKAHERTGDPLGGTFSAAVDALAEADALVVGRRVGPYRLARLLGRGGMGAVYLAVRDDEIRQRVAIKLIRPGILSPEASWRFRSEQKALASLDHPNVARFLDAGTIEGGIPYMVMEYLEGEDLESHCAGHRLDIRERLLLFRQVCSAVAHAHRNLVVHRDLKPANIVVTSEGVVKLLDFGIAKLLQLSEGAPAMMDTGTMAVRFTPAFASPEQVAGGAITTASDVYALGVLLYRLLSAAHPYRVDDADLERTVRAIREEEPVPPSKRVLRERPGADGRRLHKQLSGDLDQIALMALRKEPERRYRSVEALSEDVRRHLDGLPVSARKDTLRYRTGKFLLRHRLEAAAAALAVLSLCGGLLATTWQAGIARAAAARAEREKLRAEKQASFLEDMLRSVDASGGGGGRGADVTVAEILDEASRRLPRDLAGEPEIEASLHRTLGRSYLSLARYEPAVEELRRALALYRRSHGEVHATTARTLHELGEALYSLGQVEEAEKLSHQAADVYRALPDVPPEAHAAAFHDLAVLLFARGKLAEAESMFQQAIDAGERSGRPLAVVASSIGSQGAVADRRGDGLAAERYYRRALEIYASLPQPDRMNQGHFLTLLARMLNARGAHGEAERGLRQAIDLLLPAVGEGSPFVANARIGLAQTRYLLGDDLGAEAELRRALTELGRQVADDHPNVALAKCAFAPVLIRLGRSGEAETLLREAMPVWERLGEGYRFRLALAESVLGEALAQQGCAGEAEALVESGHEGLLHELGPQHPHTQEALARVAAFGRSDRSGLAQAAPIGR